MIQVLYGPLSGYPQTTPRAELEAIAATLENALPPITIITDHLNHVEAYYRGRAHCLKVTGPLIDIWIRIWTQIHRLRKHNVVLKWVPSHQMADDNETWEQKVDRRGNEVADYWAAEGRKQHDLPTHITVALKKAEDTTIDYHKWTAYAAYSQHNGPIIPDHDIRKGPKPKRKKRTPKPHKEQDQRILNRMPFADRSLGISIWQGPEPQSHAKATTRVHNAVRLYNLCRRRRIHIGAPNTTLEEAWMADQPKQRIGIDNRHTQRTDDHDDVVPPELTAGHAIWVAGNAAKPWVWCNTCGAYTNKSVRNLAKQCKGNGNLTYTDRLAKGIEPRQDAELTTAPRRLTWADIGGRPYTAPEDNLQTITRSCLNKVYKAAYRALRVRELRALQPDISSTATNALTGAPDTNNRRRCVHLSTCQQAIPQQEWTHPSPGRTPRHLYELDMYDFPEKHGPNLSDGADDRHQPPGPGGQDHLTGAALPFVPDDDFFDVFGHGGALE